MTSVLRALSNRKMWLILGLGFSSGLPLMLTAGGSTIQAWLKDANVDVATIGRFALIGLPYALKFLWAPLLDTLAAPFWGRRRGWALCLQCGLMISLLLMAYSDPAQNLLQFALAALLVSFFSASQDIVLDALRTEMLTEAELGLGGSIYLVGYRIAILVSGAVALALSASFSWTFVYAGSAALVAVGSLAIFFSGESVVSEISSVVPAMGIRQRLFIPFTEFFNRRGAMEVLVFVMLYKLPTLMATALTTVFLMDLGFAKIEIAAVAKAAGLVATIVGTLTGGLMMVRLGIKTSLWIFGIAQTLGGGLFILLAVLGKNYPAMVGVLLADNFLMGMGTAAIVGFMMSVCSKQFTGTQYALLSSLPAFTRVILVAPAGEIEKSLGWGGFFIFSVLLGIPGLLLLSRYNGWSNIGLGNNSGQLSRINVGIASLFMLSLVVISTDFVWPKLGLPDIALQVGATGLMLSILAWLFSMVNAAKSA